MEPPICDYTCLFKRVLNLHKHDLFGQTRVSSDICMPSPFCSRENARPNGANTRPRGLTIYHNGMNILRNGRFSARTAVLFECFWTADISSIWKIQVYVNNFHMVWNKYHISTIWVPYGNASFPHISSRISRSKVLLRPHLSRRFLRRFPGLPGLLRLRSLGLP